MSDPHDRLKVVCAFDSDLARARGTVLRPPSAVSSFGGFRTPAAEHAATSLKRPASETLHTSRLMHRSKNVVIRSPRLRAQSLKQLRWKRVGCSNGRSAGLAPFKMRSIKEVARS